MRSFARAVAISALLTSANAQGIIVSAKGTKGTSLSLQLEVNNAQDANIISDAEISTNIVNECGRTLANGNIDIGQNTEDALAANQVTQVTKDSKVAVTINQVNAQGAGPFTCDMDQTSNSNGINGQTKLQVQQGNTRGNGNTVLTVTMPADMACIGASTGNICTVRCRNTQNFGGCFAVQQTDVTPNVNTADNVKTAATLGQVLNQVSQDIKDFPEAVAANNGAPAEGDQGLAVADALLAANPTVTQGAARATATAGSNNTANAGKRTNTGAGGRNRGAKGKKANANRNAATGNANANANGNGRGNNGNGKNNSNNKRRVENALRWAKRFVVEGAEFKSDDETD